MRRLAHSLAVLLLVLPARADEREAGVQAAAAAGDAARTAHLVEGARARRLVEGIAHRDLVRASVQPAEARTAEAAARARVVAAWDAVQKARAASDRKALRDARPEMTAARENLRAVLRANDRLVRRVVGTRSPEPASLDEIRAALEDDEALVFFALLPESSYAVVATRAEGRVVPLGPTAAIAQACDDLPWGNARKDVTGQVERLRMLVADPLGLPAGARRLLVSPDGELAEVPFTLLAPGREVAYVPSGTALVLLRARPREQGTGVLALGDPQRAGGLGARKLLPLPTTGEEAAAVGDEVLVGEDATLPRLAAALAGRPRWHALHLAGHCILHPTEPDLSALAMTPGPADDGLWTAVEIEHARIEADLVVLSSVNSARGLQVPSEGPVSVAHAFLVAGTPRVVASLAVVDDASTLVFMKALHARWKAGRPAATALREAQEEVRSHERWRHPYYWAAWILLGVPE